jgi:hypothetical protein
MLSLLTYQIKPYLLIGEPAESYLKANAEWIRDAINMLTNRHRQQLIKAGVDTSLFHNHNETNSQTRTTYPLVLYQHHNEMFFVTGINEGAQALSELFAIYHQAVQISNTLLLGFSLYKAQETEIAKNGKMHTYRIHNYLALDARTHKLYEQASAVQKIQLLEQTLQKHFENDMFKYLNIAVESPVVEITRMNTEPKSITYKTHRYLSFDLDFSADVQLPAFMALGTVKAFGYGMIEII